MPNNACLYSFADKIFVLFNVKIDLILAVCFLFSLEMQNTIYITLHQKARLKRAVKMRDKLIEIGTYAPWKTRRDCVIP